MGVGVLAMIQQVLYWYGGWSVSDIISLKSCHAILLYTITWSICQAGTRCWHPGACWSPSPPGRWSRIRQSRTSVTSLRFGVLMSTRSLSVASYCRWVNYLSSTASADLNLHEPEPEDTRRFPGCGVNNKKARQRGTNSNNRPLLVQMTIIMGSL